MSSVLEVRQLRIFRGSLSLIKPVSFGLSRGEIVRITGDNGTGKTTLLEAVMGFHREWKGTLDLKAKGVSYKRQRGVAFESMTLEEAWCLVIGATPAVYEDLLTSLDLVKVSKRAIGLLSGGEAQRAMLTLALARSHDLMLLDEPLAGIDSESVDLIAACLERHTCSSAVVLVEHKPSQKLRVTREVHLERSGD